MAIKWKWSKISVIVSVLVLSILIGIAFAARYEVLTNTTFYVKTIRPLAPATYITLTNEERNRAIDLASLHIVGTGPMGADGTTAPGIAAGQVDGIPAVVYASSAEVASIGYTFRIPKDYLSGMGFRILVSSSHASPVSLDWSIHVQEDGATFAADPYEQDEVGMGASYANIAVSNEVLVFDVNATVDALLSVGKWITVYFWNASDLTAGDNTARTTEIKGIDLYYTPRLCPTT